MYPWTTLLANTPELSYLPQINMSNIGSSGNKPMLVAGIMFVVTHSLIESTKVLISFSVGCAWDGVSPSMLRYLMSEFAVPVGSAAKRVTLMEDWRIE